MKAVVYGGGNIGRGFLGQLLYNSGFETVFVDVNRELIDKLNETHSYPIKIVSNEKQEEVEIKNVRAVTPDDAVDEIATADIIFTSAGVRILPYVAPVLRAGIEKRSKGVDIVICENLMDADKYLKKLVDLDRDDERILLTAVYDNLGKGASGAAVEVMNIILGKDETSGLNIT